MALRNIGFIQGRLSPISNNKIQQFPHLTWKDEFLIATKNELKLIEWTIDTITFTDNPLINPKSWAEIITLSKKHDMRIPSVTCDYFMENPVWKSDSSLLREGMISIIKGMANIGSKILVIPLVDNSSLKNLSQIEAVKNFFSELIPELDRAKVIIAFESDLTPKKFLEFISIFEEKYFGINYDIGNSASLGFNPAEEFKAYGSRIINVHIKDRKFRGASIPLGEGDADFSKVFHLLHEIDYKGNLMLQTARSTEGKHEEVLVKYKKLVENWWRDAKIA